MLRFLDWLSIWILLDGCYRGVKVKLLDFGSEVNEFNLQSRRYFQLRTHESENEPRERYEPPYSLDMG